MKSGPKIKMDGPLPFREGAWKLRIKPGLIPPWEPEYSGIPPQYKESEWKFETGFYRESFPELKP